MRVHRKGFKRMPGFRGRARLAVCVAAAFLAAVFANQLEKRQVLAQQQAVPATAANASGNAPSAPAATQNPGSPAQSKSQTGATPPQQASSATPAAGVNPTAPASGAPATQVSEETANLLKLANSLKADVDKTSKDTLSVAVVREASQIEQLAHRMRTQ